MDQKTGTERPGAHPRSHSGTREAFPGLTLPPRSSLPADSSTLLPSASPLGLAATALPDPQASLLFLLLLPAALALLTAAWCLGWRRRRRRPCPGEQVSQRGGQGGWGWLWGGQVDPPPVPRPPAHLGESGLGVCAGREQWRRVRFVAGRP